MITTLYRARLISNVYKSWISPKAKVLDFGCGTGQIGRCIGEKFKCDISGTDIKDMRTTYNPFYLMREKMPFEDKSFDVAMMNDVLHHCSRKEADSIIQEALRVAKTVLIWDVEPTFIGYIADVIINVIHYKIFWFKWYARPHKDWICYLENLGLKVEYRKARKPWWYPFQQFALKIEKPDE